MTRARCRVGLRAATVLSVLVLATVSCAKAERDAAPAPVQQRPAEPTTGGDVPKPPAAEPAAPTPAPEQPAADSDEKNEKAKDAPKSADSSERELTTLAEAEAALQKAQGNLDTLLGAASAGRAGATPLASGDPRCESACKAFSSLRRAAAAVCRLAGEGDPRCTRAKALVKSNETRISSCGCDPAAD